MTDKPNPAPPQPPLQLPPNFRDVTAEKIGTVIGIVGATAAGKSQDDRRRIDRPPGCGWARRSGERTSGESRARQRGCQRLLRRREREGAHTLFRLSRVG